MKLRDILVFGELKKNVYEMVKGKRKYSVRLCRTSNSKAVFLLTGDLRAINPHSAFADIVSLKDFEEEDCDDWIILKPKSHYDNG